MVLEDWSTMYEPASNSKVFESSFEPVYVTYTGAAVGKPSVLSPEMVSHAKRSDRILCGLGTRQSGVWVSSCKLDE